MRKAAEQAQAALQHEILAQQERAALELGCERQQAKETLDQLLAEQLNETRAMTAEFQKAQALLQELVGQLREQLRGNCAGCRRGSMRASHAPRTSRLSNSSSGSCARRTRLCAARTKG